MRWTSEPVPARAAGPRGVLEVLTTRRTIGFLLLVACLGSSGCAGIGRLREDRAAWAKLPEDDHAVLERELGLYSD